ncbi:hypothetical protein MMC34_005777 [Xylographa carneopallida]|nr:hypothetical protein [Xylographa carneopallida]
MAALSARGRRDDGVRLRYAQRQMFINATGTSAFPTALSALNDPLPSARRGWWAKRWNVVACVTTGNGGWPLRVVDGAWPPEPPRNGRCIHTASAATLLMPSDTGEEVGLFRRPRVESPYLNRTDDENVITSLEDKQTYLVMLRTLSSCGQARSWCLPFLPP